MSVHTYYLRRRSFTFSVLLLLVVFFVCTSVSLTSTQAATIHTCSLSYFDRTDKNDTQPNSISESLARTTNECPTVNGLLYFGQYTGTMVVYVRLTNVYGQNMGVYKYEHPATIYISEPLATIRGFRETNEFNLIVHPQRLTNAPGEVTVFSAYPFDQFGFFQYWNYSIYNNNTFSGRLTDTYNDYGLAVNLLTVPREIAPNLWMPYTVAMVQNSEIYAEYNDTQVGIHIASNTTDLANGFDLYMVGTRPVSNNGPISNPFGDRSPIPPINRTIIYLPMLQSGNRN